MVFNEIIIIIKIIKIIYILITLNIVFDTLTFFYTYFKMNIYQ